MILFLEIFCLSNSFLRTKGIPCIFLELLCSSRNGIYNILFFSLLEDSGISNKLLLSMLLFYFCPCFFCLFLSLHLIFSLCCSEGRGGGGWNECMKVTPHMNQKYGIIQKGKQLRKNKSCFNVPELVLKNTDVLYAYEFFD